MPQRADAVSFDPTQLDRMGRAFEAALDHAADEASPFAALPPRELRLTIARAVVDEARRDVGDPDCLSRRALGSAEMAITAL